MWKRILVPHDFSPCAARALRLAVELAKVHRATEVVILHVSDLPENLERDALVEPEGERTAITVADYARRGAIHELEEIALPLRQKSEVGGLSVVTKAVTGDVADAILAEAQTLDADVIIVGTHGRKGLSHLLLGSIAEQLVRRASIPVVTVRSVAQEAEPIEAERDAEDELAG